MSNEIVQKEIAYKRLTESSEEAVEDLNKLLKQLSKSGRQLTVESLNKLLSSPTEILVAIADERIVGYLCLAAVYQPARIKGWIEDVVVDEPMRGHGIAKHLLTQAIETARSRGFATLNLTSGSDRTAARGFYESMGFKERDSSLFRMEL